MTELEKIAYAKSFIDKLANGKQIGISLETRNGINGEYQVVVYNKEAQAFILDNIDAIIASENK